MSDVWIVGENGKVRLPEEVIADAKKEVDGKNLPSTETIIGFLETLSQGIPEKFIDIFRLGE